MTAVVGATRPSRRPGDPTADWTPARRAAELAESATAAADRVSFAVERALAGEPIGSGASGRNLVLRSIGLDWFLANIWALNAGRIAQGLEPVENVREMGGP